jgi:preprotein translocase subunit Sss1
MLAVAHKSDRQEFILYLKLVLMGLATAGTLGFIVQFIGSILKVSG